MKLRIVKCAKCGEYFETPGRHTKYCLNCRVIQVKKPLLAKKCLFCGEQFETTRFWGKYCSAKCRQDYFRYFTLDDDKSNVAIRLEILTRDGFACKDCGETDVRKLVVHHAADEFITLCISCHRKEHLKYPDFTYPHYHRRPQDIKNCEFCHNDFVATRKWSRFCSIKCRNDYHRQKMEEMPKSEQV